MIMYILPWLIILLSFIVVATVLVVLLGVNTIYVNIVTNVPWAKVPTANLEKIIAAISLPANALIYDLGCGDGRFLFFAEKKGFRAVGYELSIYPYLKTVLHKFISGSTITIYKTNFFRADLSQAEAVFVFLTGAVMEKIGKKLKQALKPGTPVISYGFAIPYWTPTTILETMPSKTYVYTV
ncbi:MAG: hypothetical protein WCK11_02585 [Candidatus Falkowbacteria bacterium]